MEPKVVLDYLIEHNLGCKNPISGKDLIFALYGRYSTSLLRDLSDVVAKLRVRGYPIFADDGYYFATEPDQITLLCKRLYKRAMTALKQITGLKRRAIPDLVGQLRLPVGSEPELPDVPVRIYQRDSVLVEIPVELHEAIQQFLGDRPEWNCDRMFAAATSLFLLQQGVESAVASEILVDCCFDEVRDANL